MCVNMPDLEIDLVDQFICPPCIQSGYLRHALSNLLSLYVLPQNTHIYGRRGNDDVSLDSSTRIHRHPKHVTGRRVGRSQNTALTTAV